MVSIHYFEYTPQFGYPGESHDFWELVYCDKGILNLQGGADWYILSPGQAYLHPPGQFHNMRIEKNEAANSIILSFYSHTEALWQIAGKILITDGDIENLLLSVLREAKDCFRNPLGKTYDAQLIRKEENAAFGAEQIIQNDIELLLIDLIRKNDRRHRRCDFPSEKKHDPLLNDMIQYMKEHLGQKLTIGDLVSRFSVSPTTVKKLFRTSCGCGAMAYFTELRVEHAKGLLLGGQLSCTDIAERCGFCSVHHFSKVFKDSVHMSPTEYVHSIKAMLEEEESTRNDF